MNQKQLAILILLVISTLTLSAQSEVVNGTVYDDSNGETLIGALVNIKGTNQAAVTNEYGFFSIEVTKENTTLDISYLGYDNSEINVDLSSNKTLQIRLEVSSNQVDEIVISAVSQKAEFAVKNTTMGKIEIPIEVLEKLPVIFGESDVIKIVQLMPGVKKGSGVGLGLYVRGGGNDENLILLDEATVYNPGHLLGFLSVFNTASLKSVDVYKGAFPAKYGGRLSSVIDIRMKEGNDQSTVFEGHIGNIASSLTYQRPIVKGKGSFIVSARRSYLDKLISLSGVNLFPYHFYDLNLKANYKLSDSDRIFLSGYLGRDILATSTEGENEDFNFGFGFYQGNTTSTLRWNHLYDNKKLFHNLTLISSRFRYDIKGEVLGHNVLIKSAINDVGLKLDFDYMKDNDNKLSFGAQVLHHGFRPNFISYQGSLDFVPEFDEIKISNVEVGVYGLWEKDLTSKLRVNGGLRLSSSISPEANYFRPEPRVAMRYLLSQKHSLKASYSRMSQYLHLVSGSSIALPTDLWYPVSKNVKPGVSDQIGLSHHTFLGEGNSRLQLTSELYYKKLYELIEYKEGSNLIFNNNYQDELISGNGAAYGLELLFQKDKGLLTGWLGYTLSWANRTFPTINIGETYYVTHDRRHDLSIVANYRRKVDSKFGFSGVWVYNSGSPFTPIVGKYAQFNPISDGIDILSVYPERNSYRLNGASRLDLDVTIYGKKRKKFRGEWHIGAYNVLNRVQPSRVVLKVDPELGKEKYQEKGYFGFIFSVGYKFKWHQAGLQNS